MWLARCRVLSVKGNNLTKVSNYYFLFTIHFTNYYNIFYKNVLNTNSMSNYGKHDF